MKVSNSPCDRQDFKKVEVSSCNGDLTRLLERCRFALEMVNRQRPNMTVAQMR